MAYRASASGTNATANSATVTVPAGTVAGDLILAAFFWPSPASTPALSSSAGTAYVTQIAPTAGSKANVAVYSRVATAGDVGSVLTFSTGTNLRIVGSVWVESNVTSIDATTFVTDGNATRTVTIPSATPTGGHASDRHVTFYGGEDTASAVNSLSSPSGGFMVREFIRSTDPTLKNVNIASAARQLTGSGATTVETSTASADIWPMGVSILVFPSDAVPIANAGPAQAVAPLQLVTLDGTASSDSEGGALTYSWSQTGGPAVTLSSSTASQPTFTAPASVDEVPLTFSLRVSDPSAQQSTPSTVVVTVAAGPYLLRRQAGVWVRRKLLRRAGGAWVWP